MNLSLNFNTQIDVKKNAHWEIIVSKLPSYPEECAHIDQHTACSVPHFNDPKTTLSGTVKLGRDNYKTHYKKACPSELRQYSQSIAAHEFGHMIGLGFFTDEYKGNECVPGIFPHGRSGDYASIMNIGQQVRARHKLYLINWLNAALEDKDIK